MRTWIHSWTLLLTVLATTVSLAQQPQNGRANANYGKLPLTLEANQGQSDPQVKFLSRGKGYTAFLSTPGLTLSLRPREGVAPQSNACTLEQGSPTLNFTWLGSPKNPTVSGEDPQPGRVNYFFGNDPTK